MTVHLYLLAIEGINLPAAYGTALLLMVMILGFNLSARWILAALPEGVDDEPIRSARGQRRSARRRPAKIDVKNLDFYYGDFHALTGITVDIKSNADHRVHRPVGLRQVDVPALLQPHERPDPRHAGRGHDDARRRGHLRPGRRPGRPAPPRRHDLPAAEPVPACRSTTTSPTARACRA